jgi:uncharacterized membrane protein
MRIHRKSLVTEGHVENHIGRFPANTGQADQFVAIFRNDSAKIIDQFLRQQDHVLCLVAEQANGLDVLADCIFAQGQHLLRRISFGKQRARCLVHAGIGRLSRQDHGDKQGIGVDMLKFALGFRLDGFKDPEDGFQRSIVDRLWRLGRFGAATLWGLFLRHDRVMIVSMSEHKPPDLDAFDQPVFTARIHPQRSMTPNGVAAVLVGVAVVSFVASMPFVLMGAWPVAGFFGLDVLLLWFAFRIQAREAHAYEEIVLTRPEMLIRNVCAKGRVREARFNPYWVRLKRDVHAEWGVERLSVQEGPRSHEIARYLGRSEKGEFATALQGGLNQARENPVLNP